MKTAEIAGEMMEQGFVTPSAKHLRNAIFTGMTRKPSTFKKLEAGTWALVERNGNSHE